MKSRASGAAKLREREDLNEAGGKIRDSEFEIRNSDAERRQFFSVPVKL